MPMMSPFNGQRFAVRDKTVVTLGKPTFNISPLTLPSVALLTKSSTNTKLKNPTLNQFAAVKMNMMCAALTSLNTVNHTPTCSVVDLMKLNAMDNAGPKTSHAATETNSTAQLRMTPAFHTAAVEIMKLAVKRERNACHTTPSAATSENMNAMENVSTKTSTVAHTELHGAITPTPAQNTAVMNQTDSPGAKKPRNVTPTAAQLTLFGAHTLESALIMKNTAAH